MKSTGRDNQVWLFSIISTTVQSYHSPETMQRRTPQQQNYVVMSSSLVIIWHMGDRNRTGGYGLVLALCGDAFMVEVLTVQRRKDISIDLWSG